MSSDDPQVVDPKAKDDSARQEKAVSSAVPVGDEKGEDSKPDDAVIGSAAMRPVFLGNLIPGYSTESILDIFKDIRVDRVDQKRGFCFVFLKDAEHQSEKERIEAFVSDINGREFPNVSNRVRAEFARGDGRIKRKEDERRRHITPSDTLFVVNFESRTQKNDLEMLFSPFGELRRVDMKNNYAFVQFATVEQATKAKEGTNGGKMDQSVLAVEYVAAERRRRDRGPPPRHRRGPSPPPPRYDDRDYRGRSGGYRDDYRGRPRSPPPYRERSRSRSPPGYRRSGSSPPRGGRYDYDDRRYGDRRYGDRRPPSPRGRPSSPGDREHYRNERGRGYRH